MSFEVAKSRWNILIQPHCRKQTTNRILGRELHSRSNFSHQAYHGSPEFSLPVYYEHLHYTAGPLFFLCHCLMFPLPVPFCTSKLCNIYKGKSKAIPLHAMVALGGDRRYNSYSLLTSALDGDEWSASRPEHFML
jgi:hypothetical protein